MTAATNIDARLGGRRQFAVSPEFSVMSKVEFAILLCTTVLLFALDPIARDTYGAPYVPLFAYAVATYIINFRDTPLPLNIFLGVGAAHVALSYMGVQPLGWADVRLTEVIPRQAMYVVGFPLVTWMFVRALSQLSPRQSNVYWRCVLLSCMAALTLNAASSELSLENIVPYGFSNWEMGLAVSILVSVASYPILLRAVFGVAAIASVALQNRLAFALVAVAWRNILRLRCWLLAFCVGAPLISISFVQELASVDRNIFVRALFLKDALDGVLSSYGFGVGFGTQSIRNSYFLSFEDVTFASEEGFVDIFVLGHHNSFAEAAFRLGIPGLVCLIVVILHAIKKIPTAEADQRVFLGTMLFLFISMISNVALSSPTYLFGSCLAIGVLWSLGPRDRASQACRPRPHAHAIPRQ